MLKSNVFFNYSTSSIKKYIYIKPSVNKLFLLTFFLNLIRVDNTQRTILFNEYLLSSVITQNNIYLFINIIIT